MDNKIYHDLLKITKDNMDKQKNNNLESKKIIVWVKMLNTTMEINENDFKSDLFVKIPHSNNSN